MKCERSEHEIKLIAETDFEKECLRLIESKRGEIRFQDKEWKTGPLVIKLEREWE